VYEPPPPPAPRHLAPKYALWVGAKLGWFFPFGSLWANSEPRGNLYFLNSVPWSDYASSGPMFELDIGARLSRAYSVFVLWERAQLGSGNDESAEGAGDGGDTDFWAVGFRATSDPNSVGLLTEVAIGYRRARSTFENGVEYQFTEAPLEARIGLGAEIRLNRMITLSPLATIGVGSFGDLQRVDAGGNVTRLTDVDDESDGHAWATLTLGGHFDLLPSSR